MPAPHALSPDSYSRGRASALPAFLTLAVVVAFGASTASAQGSRPRTVDFDLDGVDDVVTISNASSKVAAWHVNPDGTLGAHQDIPAGDGPSRFAVGRVNADAWPDIVVANSSSASCSVILGGPSGFGPATLFYFADVMSDIGLADLDGDGDEDVIVLTQSEIGWRPSDGTGLLGAYQKLYDLGKPARDLEVADFNDDGHEDVVVLLGGTTSTVFVDDNEIAILLADATGALGPPQFRSFPNTGSTLVSPAVSMRLFRTEAGTYQVWFWGHTPKTEPPRPTDLTYPVYRYAELDAAGAFSRWNSFSPNYSDGYFWETTSSYCPGYFNSDFGWGFLMHTPARTVYPTRPSGTYLFTFPAGTIVQKAVSIAGSYIVADMNGDGIGDIVSGATNAEITLGHEIVSSWEGNYGSVYPQGKIYAQLGSEWTFSIYAATGYAIQDVLVDGISQGPVDSFTFADVDSSHTIHATFINPTPVRPSLVDTRVEPGRVSLRWFGSAPHPARVERREEQTGWTELGAPREESPGLLGFEDLTVSAGRYAYRLAYEGTNGSEVTDATWVTVPSGYALALAGFTPNPALGGRAAISFTLASGGAARLEVYDVSGRNVLAREVGSLGPGRHTLEIGGGAVLHPGVYWLRLAQGGRVLGGKGLVLE